MIYENILLVFNFKGFLSLNKKNYFDYNSLILFLVEGVFSFIFCKFVFFLFFYLNIRFFVSFGLYCLESTLFKGGRCFSFVYFRFFNFGWYIFSICYVLYILLYVRDIMFFFGYFKFNYIKGFYFEYFS